MNYEKIKQELPKIIEIVSGVPEQFKEKCFDVLLNALLAEENQKKHPPLDNGSQTDDQQTPPAGDKIPTPAVVRVFMRKSGVTEDDLNSIMLYDNNDIHFVKTPNTQTVSQGQIEWSLLLALKNAILSNELKVDPEDVRSICQEKGYYDSPNFAKNFKYPATAIYFKGLMQPQGEAQILSDDGQSALGKLVKNLVGQTN